VIKRLLLLTLLYSSYALACDNWTRTPELEEQFNESINKECDSAWFHCVDEDEFNNED